MNEEENVRRTSKWQAKLPVRPGPCLVVTLLIVFGLSTDIAAAASVRNLEQKRSPAAVPSKSSSSSSSYVERSPRSVLAVSGRQRPAVREPANCTDDEAVEAAPRQRLNGTPEARPCSASAVYATPERPGDYSSREALRGEEEIGRNATEKSEDASGRVGPLLFGMRLQAEQGHQASVLTADQHTGRWPRPSAAALPSSELELRPCEPHTVEARHRCSGATTESSSGDVIANGETALPDGTQNRLPAQRRHLPSQEQTQSAGMPGSELPISRDIELRDPVGSEGVLDTTSRQNPVSTAAPHVANRATALEDDFSASDLHAALQMQAPAGTYSRLANADATHRSDDARLPVPDTSGASTAFIATQQLLGAALDGLAATPSSAASLDSGAVAQNTSGMVLYSTATSPEKQHSPSSVHDHLPPLDNSNVLSGAAATQEARNNNLHGQRTSSARQARTQSDNLAGAAGSSSATTPHVSLTTDHWSTAAVTLSATVQLTSSAATITEPAVAPSVSARDLLSEKTELGSGSEWPAQRLSLQGGHSQQPWQQTAGIHTSTASTWTTPAGYSTEQRDTPSAESSAVDAWVRTTRTASNVDVTQRATAAIGQVDTEPVTDMAAIASESFATPCKNDSQPGGRCLPADSSTEGVPMPAAAIAGAAVGVVVGLAWIVGVPLACALCCRSSRRRRTEGQERMARYRQHQTEHSYLEELVMLELAKARSRGYVCDSDKVNYDEVFNLNASVANQITTEL